MIDYKRILKDFDCKAFLIETEETLITKESVVCISPFCINTGKWVSGMNLIIPISVVLEERLPIVIKEEDKELRNFLDTYYPKGV